MGLFLERNSSRQGREGKMVFHFTGAEIPQRNIKSMIGNTVPCQHTGFSHQIWLLRESIPVAEGLG